jgi:hypothetical protein
MIQSRAAERRVRARMPLTSSSAPVTIAHALTTHEVVHAAAGQRQRRNPGEHRHDRLGDKQATRVAISAPGERPSEQHSARDDHEQAESHEPEVCRMGRSEGDRESDRESHDGASCRKDPSEHDWLLIL